MGFLYLYANILYEFSKVHISVHASEQEKFTVGYKCS